MPVSLEIGDRIRLDGVVRAHDLNSNGAIISVYFDGAVWPADLYVNELGDYRFLSRTTSTLTQAEAEALLTEKLGESVRIE